MIIEDREIITSYERGVIKSFIPNIDFYWKPDSTTDKFPMYAHLMVRRPQDDSSFNSQTPVNICSPYFEFFKGLVDRFCANHGLQYSTVIRACINSTFHIPGYPHGDPHIDFTQSHMVLIIYLSEISLKSSTLIFNKQFDNNFPPICDVNNRRHRFGIKKRIKPEFGKILAFDGKYYHSNKSPLPGETRMVAVFNLLC